MPKMQLNLETLADFDYGKAAEAFRQALASVVRDCMDRPGEKKARTVTLTASIVPVVLQDGDVVDAEVDFSISNKIPKWQTAARPLAVDRQGRLFFNDMAPDNPRQMDIEADVDE